MGIKIISANCCPACGEKNSNRLRKYPGDFLNVTYLLKCLSCSLVYAEDIPSEQELDKYYANEEYYGSSFNPFESSFYEFSKDLAHSRIDFIKSYCSVLSDKNSAVLDIGTGNGVFLKILSEYDINKLDCIEPDINMFKQSNLNIRNHFKDIAEAGKFKYDLICLNQVLEHVGSPQNFIETACRLLKDQGILYIDVPHEDYRFKDDVSPHVTFWNKDSLEKFLTKNNCQTIQIKSCGMLVNDAKFFFNGPSNLRFLNPKTYLNALMRSLGISKAPQTSQDTFKMNSYNSDRMWIRCIAMK